MIYENLIKNFDNIKDVKNNVLIHFINGPYVEIKGPKNAKYKVNFINNKTGEIAYSTVMNNNCWCRCSIEYFVEWKIVIYENDIFWHETLFYAEGKRVYIAMDSKALGDSLAWIPYVEEFRKKHNCELIVETKLHEFFKPYYNKYDETTSA